MVNIRRDQLPQEEQDFLEEYDRIAQAETQDEENFEKMLNADESFGEKVFNFFTTPLRGRPKNLTKFINKNPDLNIVEIRICRKPVAKYINFFVNLITKGEVEKAKSKYNYDDIFHLYVILIFSDGRAFHLEKNEIVIINQITPEQNLKNTDCHNRFVSNKNFKKLIEDAESDYKNFYFYSAHRDNCQAFVRQITRKLGIRDLNRFIMQYGASDVLQDKGARNFSLKITTMANAGRRLLGLD